jgi:murein L,D-transpeptidase YafK
MRNILTKSFPFLIALVFLTLLVVKWQFPESNLSKPLALARLETTTKPLNELIRKGTEISILIDKSDYQLHVYTADTLVKTYPVVLGGNPIDDKLREGDQCTPEGTFNIVSKYPHGSWSKFIWIHYPTADSWRKHKKAKADGIIPQNATIGGEIGIHGVPKGADVMIKTRVNWTLGCISLTNADVNEIYPFIDKKTEITIRK